MTSEEKRKRRLPTVSLAWTLLTALISAVVVSISGVIYTGVTTDKNNEKIAQQQVDNNRRWCDLLTTLDDAYSAPGTPPPATPLGRRIAQSIHELTIEFGC